MFQGKMIALAALTLVPASSAPDDLVDVGNWTEVALPGAPFRVDIPMPLTQSQRDVGSMKVTSWKAKYGLMNITIDYEDNPGNAVFTPRRILELMGSGLAKDKTDAKYSVTDIDILGYSGAKLELEYRADSGGRLRVERLAFRVGQDDWVVQTTRFTIDGTLDSAHIFRSIAAPALMPALAPAKIGAMTIRGFGKPVKTSEKLDANAAKTYANWDVYAFDYAGKTKAWVYHWRLKPTVTFDPKTASDWLVGVVANQSNPKPRIFPYPQRIGGRPGMFARGQAVTGDGEEAFRIVSVGEGQEGWAILAAGPNSARTEKLLSEMVGSIAFAP